MEQSTATRWGNHDITSDGWIVEECIRTTASDRRITWYDERGRVERRERVTRAQDAERRGRSA